MMVAAESPLHSFATTFGLILTGIGLIFLLVGLLIWGTLHRFRRVAAWTQGTIVGFNATDPSTLRIAGSPVRISTLPGFGASFVYCPMVEFTTADGTSVRATSNFGSNPRRGNVGDSVTVFYDPRNPQRVQVDTGTGQVLMAVFVLVGGAVAAVGIWVLVAHG